MTIVLEDNILNLNGLRRQLEEMLAGKYVLVIEPTPNYRTSIKNFLTNLKIKHQKHVSTVGEARREMLTTKVGFFIVEWSLSDVNGLQFCRELKQTPEYKDIPFLLLSLDNKRGDVVLASEVSIDAYLLKPFSFEDFSEQITAILRRKLEPTILRSNLDAGENAIVQGKFDAAKEFFEQALLETPNSARGLCGLARICKQREQLPDALKLLHKAVQINNEYMDAYRLMLEVYEEQGDKTGMVQTASILHSFSPDNPRYTLMLAVCALEANDLEASENFFRKTISLSPRLAEAYKGLGNLYLMQDEYEKAMKNYRKALDLDQSDASTLNSLGLALVRNGQVKEGIEKYLMALKLNPHDARILFNLGHAYEKRSDIERARWYYRQALVNQPDFDKAKRGIQRLNAAS